MRRARVKTQERIIKELKAIKKKDETIKKKIKAH